MSSYTTLRKRQLKEKCFPAACEDHGAADHLNVSLAQAVQVSTDAHRAAGDVGQGERLLRSPLCAGSLRLEGIHRLWNFKA